MTRKYNLIGLAVLSIICSWACNSPQNNGSSTDSVSIENTDTVRYQMTEHYQSSPYFHQNEGGYDTTYFRAVYPESTDSLFNQFIMLSLGVKDKADLEHMGETFLAEYNSYVEEAGKPELTNAWYSDISSRVSLYTPELLVVRKTISEYTGGAHGNFAELYHNFDLQSGKQLSLSDVVNPAHQPELVKLAEQIFRKDEGLSADEPFDNRYFFDDGIFVLAENFAFDNGGLVFQYNPYEIKPWSEGVTQLVVPYAQLNDWLTDSGSRLVGQIQQTHR